MSNTDSFIDEVTEEVRRDRLFALFRRWGWLAVVLVVGIVATAAWFEYSRAQERAAAQAFGDALLASLDGPEAAARVAALSGIATDNPEAAIIVALLAAAETTPTAPEAADVAAGLRAAAEAGDLPRRYRDLAVMKAEWLSPSDPAAARLIFDVLAAPGAPYAMLAEEQLALLDLRSGDTAAALARLQLIARNAAATPGLQERAAQLIVAIEAGASLIDTAPATQP
ncbi:hypothetical protein LSUCC0031_09645 [Rhodobacterales bacterium LSUCC0031]|nr:hypothetical protein [Rhodobacterales bacterium LSUCC0031]